VSACVATGCVSSKIKTEFGLDRNSEHTLRVAIFLLFASNGLTISSWVVHIPVLKEQLQLNDQMLGFALLGAGLGSLLTMWISGWLMARYSSRTIAHLSGILFPVSLMGPALATGFWSLAIALVLMGGANGLMDIAMNSQAASYERLIGRPVMSSFHAGWSLSCWCGSLCGSLFLAEPGWLILHLPLIALIGSGLTIVANRRLLSTERSRKNAAILSFPRGILAVFGLLCLIVMMTEGAVADWAGVHLRVEYRVAESMTVFGYNAFSLCMTAGRFAGDRLAHSFGRKGVIVVSAAVSTLGLVSAALAPTSWLCVAGFALTGCGMANLVPLLFSLAAVRAGTDVERATSSVFATGYLGFLIGPPLVGLISNHTSLPIALLCLAGGVLLVGSTILRLNGLHCPVEAPERPRQ
jgi:MFS family permease